MWLREHEGRRYVCWKANGKQKRQLEHRWVWEQAHGPIPEGHHIHHKDENPLNNQLDNLECLPAVHHRNLHNRVREQHQLIDGVEHRKCQRCLVFKPLIDFTKRRAGTYHGYCKICVKQHLADWRMMNREHWNAYHREYRSKAKQNP